MPHLICEPHKRRVYYSKETNQVFHRNGNGGECQGGYRPKILVFRGVSFVPDLSRPWRDLVEHLVAEAKKNKDRAKAANRQKRARTHQKHRTKSPKRDAS